MKMTTYTGVTRLLKKPVEENGTLYPFAFDSDIPDHLHTSYRLMATSDSDALTDAALAQMLKCSRRGGLEADVERTEGRLLMWITIIPEPPPQNSSNATANNGGGGGGSAPRVRLEKGPDLDVRLSPPGMSHDQKPPTPEPHVPDVRLPEIPPPRRPDPEPRGPDMDMF